MQILKSIDDASATGKTKQIFEGLHKALGLVPNLTRVLANSPAALDAYAAASPEPMPPGPFELFRVALTEAVLVRIGEPADHLLIEHWRPGRGLERVQRY